MPPNPVAWRCRVCDPLPFEWHIGHPSGERRHSGLQQRVMIKFGSVAGSMRAVDMIERLTIFDCHALWCGKTCYFFKIILSSFYAYAIYIVSDAEACDTSIKMK
mmetsp:Transcript_1893/g.2625  ORF Transcript_1893/g.2625 Transcript_1893/m.2625 type:complete len:104 (+) Transcript_1893:791-1102(+)